MGHRILERCFLFTISSLLLIYTLFVATVTFRGLNFTTDHLNKTVLIGYAIIEVLIAPSGLWGIFGAIQNNPFQAKRYVKDHWFSLLVMTIIDGLKIIFSFTTRDHMIKDCMLNKQTKFISCQEITDFNIKGGLIIFGTQELTLLFLGFLASYSANRISEKPKTTQKVESGRRIETVESGRGIETVESAALEPSNSFIRQSSQYMTRRKSIGYNDDNNIMIDVNKPPTMNHLQNVRMLPPIVRSQSFVMPPPIVRSQSFVMPQQQKPIYHQYTSPPMNSNMYPQNLPILMHPPKYQNQQFRNSHLQIVTTDLPRPISLGNMRRSNSQPQFRIFSKEISEYEKEKVPLDTKGPSNIQPSSPSPSPSPSPMSLLSPPISSMSPITDRNTIRHSKSLPMMYNKYSEINNKQISPSLVPSPDNQQYKETNDISNDINSQIVAENENHEFLYLQEINFD
ncbi:hypothetical protein Glove_22g156 [Diversispora epigaea]|uniref:Uncharacterized protein n=1 Tax=Diversispora epigaea TaxID=1348612 RepID=A0A397JJA5_9GLOM|nr:hypothetical protein Glove_22g156 [Diversispora epigaea]